MVTDNKIEEPMLELVSWVKWCVWPDHRSSKGEDANMGVGTWGYTPFARMPQKKREKQNY